MLAGPHELVGQILRVNPTPIVVPCHRVVKSDGEIGGYGGASGSWKKIKLLRSEGLQIRDGKVLDMEKVSLYKVPPKNHSNKESMNSSKSNGTRSS